MTLARLRSHGHPAIRAVHANSWELVAEHEVTERGTCIIGVGTEVVDGSLDGWVGPITIDLAVADRVVTVDAVANPDRAPSRRGFVVRRGRARTPATLATDATVGSDAFDRVWVERMTDPDVVLDVTIRRRAGRPDGRPSLVIGRVTGGTLERARAEVAAADAVVAESTALAALARDPADARARLAAGGRVLVVSADELAGRTVPELVGGVDDVEPETFGLSPVLSVAAVLGGASSLQVFGRVDSADSRRRLLAEVAAGRRVVASMSEAHLLSVLDHDDTGGAPMVVAVLMDPGEATAQLIRQPGRRRYGADDLVAVGLGSALGPDGDAADEPGLEPTTLIAGLLAAGVSRRTIVTTLAGQPGWSRNRAYEAVLRAAEPTAGETDER